MRIYLDNCCYNRPFDDQSQVRISLETQAKLFIQEMIMSGKLELAASYVLLAENDANRSEAKKASIRSFVAENVSAFVPVSQMSKVKEIAKPVMETGIKYADACHIACAIISRCDFFVTTDMRVLKYRSEQIRVCNPTELISLMED